VVMRPYIVKAAYDADGREVLVRTPQTSRRAITPDVAHTMNQVLRGVVNGRNGTAHLARVADFTVAGKTGTAQMVNPATRAYYRDRLVASFVGFVPAEDPKLVILVVLYDVPRGHFGGLVAAPVFSEIASDALQRMAVTPAYPHVERANLLPVGNSGFFSSSDNEDHDSNLPSVRDRVFSGIADRRPTKSAANELRESNPHIPDFHGLSLRSALALAHNYRLALEVKGAGYVVSQQAGPEFPEMSDRLSNPQGPKQVVQIVLAAPHPGAPDLPPPLEGLQKGIRKASRLRSGCWGALIAR